MHFSPDAPRSLAARLVVGVALTCGAVAQAQTLIDTSAAIGVQNTLNQIPTVVPNVPAVTAPAQAAQTQQTQAQQQVQQQVQAPAPAAVSAVPTAAPVASATAESSAPAITPLTPQQQTQLEQARKSLSAGNYAQARSQFENLIVANYNNPEPHFGLGLTLYTLGDLRGAAFEFGQFARFAPDRYEGPYNLGVVATREGRYAEALTLYSDALAKASAANAAPGIRLQILRALASEQSRAKDYAGQAATYAALREADPTNPEYTYRQAQALYLGGQVAEALPVTYAVLEQKPSSMQAALLLADIYKAQGLPDRAIREVNAAAARAVSSGERAELLLRKSQLLLEQKDLQGALTAASDARREDSRNPLAAVREGEILAQLGRRPEAIQAYRSALLLSPKVARYHADLAALYLESNQYKEATAAAQQALKLSPDAATQAKAQYVQGVAAFRQRAYTEARRLLNASVVATPSAEALLWLGLSYYNLKDYPSAVSVLSESVRLRPTATARQNLAAALLATGRYGEAEALLRGLVTDEPKNGEGWYLLGLSQRAQQRTAEAKQAFKTAAALGEPRARNALK